MKDRTDQALPVARRIQRKYGRKRPIRILIGESPFGLNPKVKNLTHLAQHARYELLLISDSNVRVEPDYLHEMVRPFEYGDVGLVANLIRGMGGKSLGAIFENLHLNSFVLSSVSFLSHVLKQPCVVGKSMLFKRADVDAIGGFH